MNIEKKDLKNDPIEAVDISKIKINPNNDPIISSPTVNLDGAKQISGSDELFKSENLDGGKKYHDKYRKVWFQLTEMKFKLVTIQEIQNELSPETYKSEKDEIYKAVDFLTTEFETLKVKLKSLVESEKDEIKLLDGKYDLIQKQIKESKVLFENGIWSEYRFHKENKINEKTLNKIRHKISETKKILEEHELILKYPDPEEEAKVKAKKQACEKARLEAERKIELERVKQQEKKQKDFEYQLNLKVEEIRKDINKEVILLEKKLNLVTDHNNSLREQEIKLCAKLKNSESELSLSQQKILELTNKLDIATKFIHQLNFPCGNIECKGKINSTGLCSVCELDYQSAVLAQKKNESDKKKVCQERNQSVKDLNSIKSTIEKKISQINLSITLLFVIIFIVLIFIDSYYKQYFITWLIIATFFCSITLIGWILSYKKNNKKIQNLISQIDSLKEVDFKEISQDTEHLDMEKKLN
jgi:hypothetical protein